MKPICLFLASSILLAPLPAPAAADPITDTVAHYVRQQTRGLPGKIGIAVGDLGPDTHLPPCQQMQAYMPPGSRLWGRTYIGVHCLGPTPWKVLVPVQISIVGTYITTARPIAAGQVLQAADLTVMQGDLATLPAGIVSDAAAAVGKTLKNSLGGGQPLRSDQLLAPLVIRQGQTVRVHSRGTGFSVSSDGKAINNAAEGQVAQIRMASGQVISGTARADGSVEIFY